jgi:hypothetical protein
VSAGLEGLAGNAQGAAGLEPGGALLATPREPPSLQVRIERMSAKIQAGSLCYITAAPRH